VLSRAEPVPIALIVVAVLGSLVTRAARWQVYFLPDRRVPFKPLLGTLSISYMASTFLPFRAGELVRAVFLGQREALAVARIVGTVLLEKLFDFLAIGVMLVLLLATTELPDWARVVGASIAAVILVGFGLVVALAVWRAPTLAAVSAVERRLPAPIRKRLRLEHALRQFAEGTDALRVPRLWVPMLGWTAITWTFSIASAWAGLAALGVGVGLAALAFLAVVTSAGQAVPSSPGYVGVFHGAAVLALTTFGVDPASALGSAVLIHAFSYGALVVAGLIALWIGGYAVADLWRGARSRGLA
jgi:glycosyltransferase 2 family protein